MAEPGPKAGAFAPAEKPLSGLSVRLSYALGVSTFLALSASKWAFAASATSVGISHEVFLASEGRLKALRRCERRTFGSTPISSARALGVIVVGAAVMMAFRSRDTRYFVST